MGGKPSCLCGICKTCIRREYNRRYAEKNKATLNAKRRKWRVDNPGRDAALMRDRYRADPEKWRAYWRDHGSTPEQERERYKRRRAQPDWLEYNRERQRRYRERHKTANEAQQKLQDAVRRGKVQRHPCEVCGAKPADGHHDDYTKPLDVRWFCRAHHAAHHRAQRRAAS